MEELVTVYLHLQSVGRDEGRLSFTFTADQLLSRSIMKNVDQSLPKTKMTVNVFFSAHQHFWPR